MERDAKGHFEPLIRERAKELAELIREYCRSQRYLWRQIPYLALQVEDDSSKKCDWRYHTAFTTGYLEVLESSPYMHCPRIYVDLENGELVTDIDRAHDPLPASDKNVIRFTNDLESLDAQSIVYRLRRRYASQSLADCLREEKWRREMAEKYGIEEMYVRRKDGEAPTLPSHPRREPLMVNVPTTLMLVHEEIQRMEEESENRKNRKRNKKK